MAVFVYGTLADRDRADAVIGVDDYAVLGPATLEGLVRVEGEYPTLAPAESAGSADVGVPGVDGDSATENGSGDGTPSADGLLYALADGALERLDAYEGVDRGLYVRVSVPLSERARERWPAVDRVRTYVGDPTRLGVAERVSWPGDGSLEERIRDAIATGNIVVLSRE